MRIIFLYLMGLLTFVQVGHAQCLSGSCQDGTGAYRFADGSLYTGEFKGGLPDGEGVWAYPKGEKVKGFFKKGLPVGENVFAKANQPQKTGCVSGNCKNGIGVYLDETGNRYVGYFRRHRPSGKGICYYPNGSRYDGLWQDGLPNGFGVMHEAKGTERKGIWVDGFLQSNSKGPKIIEEHAINEQESKTYAVIVGIADYDKMDKLEYADDDAYRFYSYLENTEAAKGEIRFLLDENATAEEIREAIQDVAQKADENDKIVLYYSGHGIEKAIIPFGSDGKTGLLTHHEISELLKSSAALSKTFYVDACNVEEPEAEMAPEPEPKDITIFYSSRPGENSLESPDLGQGVFSYYLIDGLKGAADENGDGRISDNELYNYVFINVKNYTEDQQYPSLAVSR